MSLFYADVMDQEDFIMNSIISDLRASLAREKEIELEGDSSNNENNVILSEDVVEDTFDRDSLLALESDINIDEKVLESLIINGEILTDIDLALESFKYSGLAMDDLTYTALQRTYNKVAGNLRLPSIESALSETEGDRTLVKLATEAAVSQRASEVLKKIVDTIIKLFQKIKDWYIRIFDQAALQKRRAEKIAKMSGSLTGAPADMSVTLATVKDIGIGNKAVQPGQYLVLLTEVSGLTDKLTKGVSKEFNQLLGELTTLTKAQVQDVLEANGKRSDETLSTTQNSVEVPKTFVQNDDKMLAQFVDRFKRMIELLDLKKIPKEDDPRFSAPNTVYHLSEVLPGNKQMSSAYPEKLEDMVADIGKIKNSFGVGLVEVNDAVKSKGKLEVAFDTLSIVDVKRVCEEVVKICNFITEYKLNYVEREKRVDQFLKTIQSLSRSNEDLDATAKQAINSIVTGASTINKNMMNGEGRWVKYVMDIVVYSLDWCTDSLAQYDHGKM